MNRALILTVENEALLTMLLEQMLATAGYDVIAAYNADEAIAILENRSDVAFMITDVEMAGSMNGLALAAAVRRRWPRVGVIVTSGRFPPNLAPLPHGSIFVAKPYLADEIVRAIEEFQVGAEASGAT